MRTVEERLIDADFDDFVRGTGARVRRALVAYYGVEIGAEAGGEAMRVAWEHWPEVAGMDNPAGYLFRAGQSHARPYVRWSRGRVKFPSSYERAVAAVDPDSAALLDLFSALGEVPNERRAAVLLVRAYGLPYDETAELLGITVASVTNHIHRGMRQLRHFMGVTND